MLLMHKVFMIRFRREFSSIFFIDSLKPLWLVCLRRYFMFVPVASSVDFKSKKSFISLSKCAKTASEKRYWESQHYEARARLGAKKLKDVYSELDRITFSNSISSDFALFKVIPLILYRKFQIRKYSSLAEKLKG